MRNYLTIDGVDSRTYGLFISGQGAFAAPARNYSMLTVPGRDGDLIGPERSLQNIDVAYPAFIAHNFDANIEGLRNFLLSRDGYVKISDSYHPSEYRMGAYRGPFTPDVVRNNNAATFDVIFNCKPQRYLLTGDTEQTVASGGSVVNPTQFNSRPIIKIAQKASAYSGTIGIGAETITITDMPAEKDLIIDCEMMDCYSQDGQNLNSYVSFSGTDFPVLHPGTVGITSTVGSVVIKGRWFIV